MGILANLLKDKYSVIDHIYDPHLGRKITRWILMLPGAGCSWAKKKHGGCHMCGFKHETNKYTLGIKFPAFIFNQLFKEGYELISENKPELLSVFNGGSFFNEKEIPLSAQIDLAKAVSKTDSILMLMVESRPEYITKEKIQLLKSHLGNKELIVGIGLECATEEIRKKSVNKGFSNKDYEKAIEVLKNNGAEALTYILIKPAHLNERHAIDEAVNSAQYAASVGSKYIVFNAAMVQDKTLVHDLYNKGEFKPPWLWSILEVARRTRHHGAVRIGDFSDEPRPIASPHNCHKCSDEIKKLFGDYKISHDIEIFDDFHCDCRKDWEKSLV